ncbi:23350_t:CDS:2 [Gigaspora rosea]|nr:23350_t:CDS:2 [Gigaspora rosea]
MEIWVPTADTDKLISNLVRIKIKKISFMLTTLTASKRYAKRKIFPNTGCDSSRRIVQKHWMGMFLRFEIQSLISKCCNGKRNTAGGWRRMYYEDYIEPDLDEEWREIEVN